MRRSWGALLCAAAAAACAGGDGEAIDPALVRTVTRDDLVITVRERGELKAARDTRVASELEGRATLIDLIPEGSVVAAGDKVAELDTSAIEEKRALQAISVARAQAQLEQARKQVEIVEKELQAAERTAETRQRIAELRLEKFHGRARVRNGETGPADGTNAEMVARLSELIDADADDHAAQLKHARVLEGVHRILGGEQSLGLEMGEMANQILQQIDEIALARADLELASKTLYFSRKLEESGFITTSEREKDEIDYERQRAKQVLSWNNLLLLVGYTLPEKQLELELEVENARLELESVRASGDARRVQEAADLRSIEAEHALAVAQLENWNRQIEHGVLRAPAPGLVVYGRMDWDEPVYEGLEVRERQEVILLPDVSSMLVQLKVPEAQIGKLAVGQRASVRVDAFPSESFRGHVAEVATLPEASPSTQVLKLYLAKVAIDVDNTEGTLRPGMNATVTIEVGTLADALNVPLPSLERRGDVHYVWKLTPDGPVAARVELGGHDLTHVQVLAGLAEGDRFYLVRPPGAQLPASAPEAGAREAGSER
jgi:RND family efflux transporter MFP subunit